MKKSALLTVLCIFLSTTQAQCAGEAASALTFKNPSAQIHGAAEQDIFDVEAFAEKVERAELTDEEILPNLNRQNPPRSDRRGRRRIGYSTDTPTMSAARHNLTHALKTFIDLGADLEGMDGGGFTALMLASHNDNAQAVTMLANANADLDCQGKEGRTALICAAGAGSFAATKALLAAQASVNIQDNYQQAALIKTMREFHPNPEVVRALLEAKADLKIVDIYGKTAGIYASDKHSFPEKKTAIAALLAAAGGNPEQEAQENREKEERNRVTRNLFFREELARARTEPPVNSHPEHTQEEKTAIIKPEAVGPKMAKSGAQASKKHPCCEIM